MNHSSRRKESVGGRIFTFVNTAILVLIALVCLLPFINIIASSFATTQEVMAKRFILFPTTFSLDAYRYILSTPTIFRGLGVSVGVTVAGTVGQYAAYRADGLRLVQEIPACPQYH